jgi:hypothetical protein
MKRKAIVAAMVLLVAACGGEAELGSSGEVSEERAETAAPSTTMSESERGLERPPDLRVTGGATDLVIAPHSYCWTVDGQGVCADGAPQEPLPTVTLEDTSQLNLGFGLDWQLAVTLLAGGEWCNGAMVIDADPQGSPLESLGPAGTYRVEVFGRGDGGDAAWAFELVTRTDRPFPSPFVQVLWFPSDRELEADAAFYALVGNIPVPPAEIAATATVTASNGESVELQLSVGDNRGCWSSSIGFEGAPQFTAQVLELGPPPYAAVVTVAIDGSTITGTPVRWPDDFPANSNESSRVAANAAPE